MEPNKNLDSSIPVERNGEMTVFLEIHLQRWPMCASSQITALKEEHVETHIAENPKNK